MVVTFPSIGIYMKILAFIIDSPIEIQTRYQPNTSRILPLHTKQCIIGFAQVTKSIRDMSFVAGISLI